MTTPVAADGGPVGALLDRSGSGRHMLQSVPAARPPYRTDGSRHWLQDTSIFDRFCSRVALTAAGRA